MALFQRAWWLALLSFFATTTAQNFTVRNGQIFTPGFVVLNAPQPNTPLGGETLHISLDVTANGKLPQPPYPEDSSNQIFNVTVFLFSYDTGRNFTVADGTRRPDADTRGVILNQEEGSTVKHVNWVWPDCLVGDGPPDEDDDDTDRGSYNITIRQNFRLNDEDHYTILDVPIAVTNSIEASDERPSCDDLDNALLSPEEIDAQGANEVGVLFAPGDATEIDLADFDDAEGGGLELLVSKWQVVLAGLAGCAMVF